MTSYCSHPNCHEIAVGKAWDGIDNESNDYCRKHLEMATKLSYPVKLFSDTDAVYDAWMEKGEKQK